jgi:4-hydroxy-4-methyl-2-oxoglutarate aldolase
VSHSGRSSLVEQIVKEFQVNQLLVRVFCVLALAGSLNLSAQVKMTRQQILFYTADWKGERFPDGRPKIPASVVQRAANVTIEDLWDFLQDRGYCCQFENGWQALHIDRPMTGRALTAQYMPARPDIVSAIKAEGKTEGRTGGNNMWPINELQNGDVYVADGFGKIVEGTLIGSNLGSGIAAHSQVGFVFDAGIRDAAENREIAHLNGFYRGSDPSAWKDMTLTSINAPIRIGRATVLPGDLVVAKQDGIIFVPASLAAAAVASAEFTNLQDAFNFELNSSGTNGAEFEGGWTPAKYSAFAKWIDQHPDKLKMTRQEFDAELTHRSGHSR